MEEEKIISPELANDNGGFVDLDALKTSLTGGKGKARAFSDLPWYEQVRSMTGTGRTRNNIMPNKNANGKHVVYKVDPQTGTITNYKVYDVNPQNPSGFDEILGYDGVGKSHKNPVTGENLIPHVHDKTVPGKVRAPYPDEIPD